MFKRANMQLLLSAMVLLLGLSLAPVGGQALAQDLPPGVTFEVLADYGSPARPAGEPDRHALHQVFDP